MVRAFLVLFGYASLALAWSPLPQVVSTEETTCLLGYGQAAPTTQLTCWDRRKANQPEVLKELKHPTAITKAYGLICLLDDGHLRCLARDGTGWFTPFRRLKKRTDLVEFASDGMTLCAVDRAGKIDCERAHWQSYDYIYQFAIPPDLSPATQYPTVLAIDELVGCVIDDKRQVHCWSGTQKGDSYPNQPAADCAAKLNARRPTDLTNPAELQIDSRKCRACVLDRDRVVCWGSDNRQIPFPGIRRGPELPTGDGDVPLFETPRETLLLWTHSRALCVNAFGKVSCDNPKAGRSDLKPVPLPFAPLLYAENEAEKCGITVTDIVCIPNTDDEGMRERIPAWQAPHHQWITGAGAHSLEPSLRYLVPRVYRHRAEILGGAADLLAQQPFDERRALFLIEALDPILESIESDYFVRRVLPAWRNLKKTEETLSAVSSLSEIPQTVGLPLALGLLRAALPATEAALGSDVSIGDYEVALGKALAELPTAAAALTKSTQPLVARVASLAAGNSSDAGAMRFVQQLWEYVTAGAARAREQLIP